MVSKWDSEKENLEKLINEGVSYEEIGRKYNCSGNNIKNIALRLGIQLKARRIINKSETFNKGVIRAAKAVCLNCGKELQNSRNHKHKYCSNACQQNYEYKLWVNNYKQDNSIAKSTKWGQIPIQLRRYIFNKFDNKCCICGWSKMNPFTNTLPLEIDHIDGNSENNSEENLRLICPNCHSLTETYRGANRGNGRNITWAIKENKSAPEETLDVELP